MFCNIAHSCTILFHLLPKELDSKTVHTHPDLSELAVPETFDELQRLSRDLPHVFGFDGQVGEAGHALVARHNQAAAQSCSPSWIEHAVGIHQYIKEALNHMTLECIRERKQTWSRSVKSRCSCTPPPPVTLTRVVLYELLQRLKLGPGGDVVASTVQLSDLVVFDMISLDVVPVLDGEGVGPWHRHKDNVGLATQCSFIRGHHDL